MVTSVSKKTKMVTAKIQTRSFKTAVQKPVGDVTEATSIIYTFCTLNIPVICWKLEHFISCRWPGSKMCFSVQCWLEFLLYWFEIRHDWGKHIFPIFNINLSVFQYFPLFDVQVKEFKRRVFSDFSPHLNSQNLGPIILPHANWFAGYMISKHNWMERA